MQTVIGVFGSRAEANQALTILERMGYNPHDIPVVVKNRYPDQMVGIKGGTAHEDTIPTTTAGLVIGGLSGLLLGLAILTLPDYDTTFLRGTLADTTGFTRALASALIGTVLGALVGGIIGALMERRAPTYSDSVGYEENFQEGAVLLAVPATAGEDADRVRGIFQEYHAEQIRSINALRTS